MRELTPRSSWVVRVLLAAAAFFSCGVALAQVQVYVVVNPIAVCTSAGVCPTFGLSCSLNTSNVYACTQYNSVSAANATTQSMLSTPIGQVDSNSNAHLGRAIARIAGYDYGFFPVQQWNAPNTNSNPWPNLVDALPPNSTFNNYTNTSWQDWHTVNVLCGDGTVVLTSPELLAIMNLKVCQNHGGVPLSNTIVNNANPPPAPKAPDGSPSPVPLARTLGTQQSNAMDFMFIHSIANYPGAPTGTATNGIYLINQDGGGVAKSGMAPTTLGATPPFGVMWHELGHGLALTHTDYMDLMPPQADNLMTSGAAVTGVNPARTEASTSGCAPPGMNYGGQANTYGGLLYDLANPSALPAADTSCTPAMNPYADTMTTGVACTTLDPTKCTTQQGAILLSGFTNKLLPATATAGGGSPLAAATKSSTTNSSNSGSGTPLTLATGSGGEDGATANIWLLALRDSAFNFQGSSPATVITSTGPKLISQTVLHGNAGKGNFSCVKKFGLSPPSIPCLQLVFDGFTANQTVTLSVLITENDKPLTNINDLAGSSLTVPSTNGNDAGAFAETATFEVVDGVLTASNTNSDVSAPTQVEMATFVGAHQINCSLVDKNGNKITDKSQCTEAELPYGPD